MSRFGSMAARSVHVAIAWCFWCVTVCSGESSTRALRGSSGCGLDGCITSLPGLSPEAQQKFLGRMASGYIPVSEDGGRHIFYWFVESQGTPATDPLLLWTNGGPGCSGLSGFLTEMGPFRPRTNGSADLELNPYAWTEFANMVFVEIPAGVGFSTTLDPHLVYNDSLVAEDTWRFILGFLQRYPHLQALDFWLTSESYGGHYLPALATEIVLHNQGEVNFKGFVVGNPLIYTPYTNYGLHATWQAWSLYPSPYWQLYTSNECYFLDDDGIPLKPMLHTIVELCKDILDNISSATSPSAELFNPYYLGAPRCVLGKNSSTLKTFRSVASAQMAGHGTQHSYEGYDYPPCIDSFAASYLNRQDVQEAIHVNFSGSNCSDGKVTWSECHHSVACGECGTYSNDSIDSNMIPVIRNLIENASLRMMIMSGNQDSVCSPMGLQQWLWDKSIIPYENTDPWTDIAIDGQLAGYSTNFTAENGHGFRFTVINGAGHMIPTAQPKRAYEIVRKFIVGDGW